MRQVLPPPKRRGLPGEGVDSPGAAPE